MDGGNGKASIVNRSSAARRTASLAAAAAAAALIVLITIPQRSSGFGSFQIFFTSFLNDGASDADGNCCSGGTRRSGSCTSGCRTFFRVCLSNFQSSASSSSSSSSSSSLSSSSLSSPSASLMCPFGSTTTPVLGENSFEVPEVLDTFVNPIDLPFVFKWPGSFSLAIEAWHDNHSSLMKPHADPGNLSETLIWRLSFQQHLEPSRAWQQMSHRSNVERGLQFRFRVVCSSDYYGPGCSELCRARDDRFGHYNCSDNGTKICLDGWKGDYCNAAECSPGCLETHGICEEPNRCRCRLGWKGEHCDECVDYPGCEHGSCVEPFTCNCHRGWGGILCNQDLDFCSNHRPCLNGATCINTGQDGFSCLCPKGLTGRNCEVDTNDCRSNHLSCLNDGRCKIIEGSDDHVCLCTPDFHGRRCEVSSAFPAVLSSGRVTCSDRPCRNGGACLPVGSGDMSPAYRCSCIGGFSGINCEYQTDQCSSHPCLNGGRCIGETAGGVRCVCQTGYVGDRCQIDRNRCSGNPCRNNGSCVVDDEINSGFRCLCRPGFAGELCQQERPVDDGCSLSPCGQRATCLDLPTGGYRCLCPDGLRGRHCTVVIDGGACTSQPCFNGASCVDIGVGLYRCSCPRGYSGPQCKGADIYASNVVTETNGSEVTSKAPFALLRPLDGQARIAVFASLGACVLLTLVTTAVVCFALRRNRKTPKRRKRKNEVEADKDEDLLRCLNNHSTTLQLETVSSSKTVAEEKMLLASGDDRKNCLLEAQNERLSRKSKNIDCNSVTNF